MSDLVALKPGTVLADEYRIERTLGAGGFGITYLAEEIALARLVTIKEYFPVDFAARDHLEDVVPRSQSCEGDYSWGLDRFLAEAQTLARFNHPNIVRVYRFFQARNTGYIVLHYEDGGSLKGWLRSLGRAPRQPELDRLLEPLLDALETVHAADYLHRDIAPDNIMMRRDGQPVLIDFGSARGDIAKHSKTISALVKPGYSPFEQYATTSRQQGPWTDIYSLGATLYEAVTGRRPADAPSRMVADELVPTGDAALSSYRPRFLSAIDKALRLEVTERPRSIAEWRAELLAPAPPRAEKARKAPSSAAEAAPAERQPEAVGAGAVGQAAAAEAKAGAAGAGTKSKVAAAAPQRQASKAPAAGSAPRGTAASADAPRGLAEAFLDGWRKGRPPPDVGSRRRAPATPPPPPLPAASAAKATTSADQLQAAAPAPPKGRRWSLFGRRARVAPDTPEPGARKATPRSLRKRTAGSWWRIGLHLALAVGLASAAVYVQDQLPTVRREGAGLLTSQTGADVPLAQLKGHRGAVTGLAFTEDSQSIVSASSDGTLKVWNVARSVLLRTLELDAGAATALSVSKTRAVTGHKDGTVALWDIETGSRLASFKRSDAAIWAVAFAGRGDRVAAAAQDAVVAVWEAGQPLAPVHALEGHSGAVKALAFASRGPFLASGGADQTVRLWSLDKHELVRSYRGHDEPLEAVAFEPGGRTLASAAADGQIRLWSTYANRLKKRLEGHDGAVPALAFAAEGGHLVSGGADGTVRIWDAGRGKSVRVMRPGAGAVTALGISPDSRRIAAGAADGTVRVLAALLPKEGS